MRGGSRQSPERGSSNEREREGRGAELSADSMEVWWVTALLVVVALATVSAGIEESRQYLESESEVLSPENITLLREYFDHAEYKSQLSGENITLQETTSDLPEILPTPVANKRREPGQETITSEKKPSVPKKGVEYKKPSVVSKKEVHFSSSVVGKKGADPESSTPSVSPRKGVVLPQDKPLLSPGNEKYDLLAISSEGMDNSNVSTPVSGDKNVQTNVNDIEDKTTSEKEKQIPIKEKSNDTWLSASGNPLQSSSVGDVKLAAVVPDKPVKVSNTAHFKPTTADDSSASSNQLNILPIVMIVALLALVVVVVIVGYRRLNDIWTRRHYNYVDFLIDGMYE